MKRLLQKLEELAKKLFDKKVGFGVSVIIAIILIFPEFQGEFLKYEIMLRGVGFIWGCFSFILFILIWEENKSKTEKRAKHLSHNSIKIPVVF